MVKFSLFLLFFFSSIYSQQLSSTVSSNKIGLTESLIFTIKITDIDSNPSVDIKQIEDNQGNTLVSEGIDANYTDIINYAIFALIHLKI